MAEPGGGSAHDPALRLLALRSDVLRAAAPALAGGARPLPAVATTLLHLWVLRVLRTEQRAQEHVLCDLLGRLYRAQSHA